MSTTRPTILTGLRRSADGGDTWTAPEKVFHPFEVENEGGKARIHIANSELLQLSTGELLAACNYRPSVPEITPFAIAVCRSTDNGHTWSRPQVIYEAGPRFTDGCWEPCFLELPDGDVQVYFANEGPYTRSSEQQITVHTSHDKGLTWGDFRTVCFRKDSRDPLQTLLSPKTPIPNLLLTGQNLLLHGLHGVAMTALFTCADILGKEYIKKQLQHE